MAAILVHGVGQQIEFETLDQFEDGLRKREDLQSPGAVPVSTARLVRLGQQRLRRLELPMTASDGSRREVHLYEAYWAPLTEGRVTLRDVSRLLWRASAVKWWRPFARWLFGKAYSKKPDGATVFYVDLAFFAVSSFLLLYTVVVSALGAALLSGPTSSWLTDASVVDLMWPVITLLLFVGLIGAALLLARFLKGGGSGRPRANIEWVLTGIVILSLAALAIVEFVSVLWALVVFLSHRALGGAAILHDPFQGLTDTSHFFAAGALWSVFLLAGWKVREILVQYFGDVAAYISPNVLDRFADLRKEIQEYVLSVASAVYTAVGPDGRWLYEGIVIAGHSLGSVIAYDTLNRLVNDDALLRGRNGVLKRTSLFLTFGSPLDKTAFIFARQGEERTGDAREALAVAVQPLVQSYSNRTFPWVNLYSRFDPISSALKLYDEPGKPPGGVENRVDRDAVVFLFAHVDYWHNPTLFEILHGALGKP